MLCLVKGNNLFFRGTEWSSTEDFVWKCSKVNDNWWAGNKYFNIEAAYTCPAGSSHNDVSCLSLWKESHDDLCAVVVQGTPLAANHGFNCVDQVSAHAHGKTEADIGSVWLDSMGRTYCLVKVPDSNTLWFVMFDNISMANGKMSFGVPSDKMWHSYGAIHPEEIIIEERSNTQLWQSFNHYAMNFFVDGKKQDITEDGCFYGDKLEIRTEYDVIYVPVMLQYLMDHVGHNTNESQHSEDIKESYMRLCVRYEFHRNGSISTYCSFRINKDLELDYIGLVQSMTVGDTTYTYVPDTLYKKLTFQDNSTIHSFTKETWDSGEKAPYRYYQFADASFKKGMALVYDRSLGLGVNEERLQHLEHAGRYYSTRKQYPAFISGGTLAAGTYFEGFAARMPLFRYDEDLTAVCWYWIGEDIVVMIDTHNAINKDIVLPEYMNHKYIEVLDKTKSYRIEQAIINDGKLKLQADGYGYLVVRLYE